MVLIFQLLYATVMLVFFLLSLFIVFHIVKYSYDKKISFLMLVIFLTFTGLLIFSNFVLFVKLPLEDLFSSIL